MPPLQYLLDLQPVRRVHSDDQLDVYEHGD